MSPADQAPAPAPALDEVMMAMDVVDTLRHNENVALQELGQDRNDEALKVQLRRIYESQGLTVSDAILVEGIKALKESRFVYTPSGSPGSRRFAGLWVRRGAVGKWIAGIIVALGAWTGWGVYDNVRTERQENAARIEIAQTLPQQLQKASAAALAEARTTPAAEFVNELKVDGTNAIARGDATAARKAVAEIDQARAQLVQTYVVRVVSRQGEQSGIFRIPDDNNSARNYYLIVEAVTPDGKTLAIQVPSEENNQVKTVTKWGIRVPQATFDAIRRDKADDGIIQNNIVGRKPRGTLQPTYDMPVMGGTITKW